MDMKFAHHLRVGVGQGFAHEVETPKLVVRIRSGQAVRRGNFIGDEDRPAAFVWADEATEVPERELIIKVAKSGRYLWEDGQPVELADLFPSDKKVARVEKRLTEWQGFFERQFKSKTPNLFYWGKFHEEGVRLARQLQAVLIDKAVIRYCRPEQDRQFSFSPEIAL